VESLRVTLQEAIEFNRHDAIASAGGEYEKEKIVVSKLNEESQHLQARVRIEIGNTPTTE
jgi:hypothetical protein